jgi:hypothetical protein
MNPRATCLLALVVAASPAAGQTKSFFEAECWYTAPGPEWEWLDPNAAPAGPGKALAHLRRPDGRTFTLRYWPRALRPDAQSFQAFENDLLRSGDLRKLDARRRSFKDTSCFEIDVRSARADEGARIRAVFANGNGYQLTVTGAPDRLGSTEETDAIFQGFEFRPPGERMDDDEGGDGVRPRATRSPILGVFGLVPVIAFFVWLYRLRKAAVG